MAILYFEDGSSTSDESKIQKELEPMGVELNRWKIDSPVAAELLSKESMEDEEKEEALAQLDHYFQDLKEKAGYRSRDLIVLSKKTPNLDELLKKFDNSHYHEDDEVRFVVDGEGVFGFARPDKSQIELKVQAGDYINVPKETEHWFYLTEKRRIKAVRYFSGMEGWTPKYTNTQIRIKRT